MRRRPGRIGLLGALCVGAVLVIWIPALIAIPYTRGPGGVSDVWTRPDQGWEFIVDAVTESRGTQLGTADSALQRARELWPGPRMRAVSVELTWTRGSFVVPVPHGGVAPARDNRLAVPPTPLQWIVTGIAAGGPAQMIGMIDYGSGRSSWDLRTHLRASA